MSKSNRPDEAVLPSAARPQFVYTSKRPRVDHLSKYARVQAGTEPWGLPNRARIYDLKTQTPGSSPRGHAYRNAVFQALLNTPMFVNFVRMHTSSWVNACPIKPHCLTCAMANLAGWYWTNGEASVKTESVNHFCDELWSSCQKTFWPRSSPTGRVGPADLDDEFFPDTFLLHFLAEMRNQLECSPNEFQTFEKMFTVHTVRRWRCKQNTMCQWASAPYKWVSSLYLALSVQKPRAKTRQTKVLFGIRRALQVQERLASRRGSTVPKSKCDKCSGSVESVVEIENLPEILIVIRDTKELGPEDDPDIPFEPELNLRGLTSGPDDINDPKTFELVSGVGEHRYSPRTSRNYAFVRGAEDMRNRWWCALDEHVPETNFSALEMSQRSEAEGGLASWQNLPLCPEIFIYRRKEWDNRMGEIDCFGPESPLNHLRPQRDLMSRSVDEIFTQKIGRGLLKFKVKLAPANPAPQEVIEVDLKMSYELDGKHYGVKRIDNEDRLEFQLHPLNAEEQYKFNVTRSQFEGGAIDRALRRLNPIYPATQEEGAAQVIEHASQQGIPDPTASSNALDQNAEYDTMDIDPAGNFNPMTVLWKAETEKERKKNLEKSIAEIVEKYKLDSTKGPGVTKKPTGVNRPWGRSTNTGRGRDGRPGRNGNRNGNNNQNQNGINRRGNNGGNRRGGSRLGNQNGTRSRSSRGQNISTDRSNNRSSTGNADGISLKRQRTGH